jgi:GNAT superfamily N-acetyltransferase
MNTPRHPTTPTTPTTAPFTIVPPASDDLWRRYIDCRYRNLYLPFGLDRAVAVSELDSPRDRPDVLHRVALDPRGEVAACGRLDLQPAHPAGPSAQLRYCAVDERCRGAGAGQALLRHFEEQSLRRNLPRLWMEARTAALNFYLRQGYEDTGPGPTKFGLIPHRILEKHLAPDA